jgi:hypothetical protein
VSGGVVGGCWIGPLAVVDFPALQEFIPYGKVLVPIQSYIMGQT